MDGNNQPDEAPMQDNHPMRARAVSDCVSANDFYSCEAAIRRLHEYLDHELSDEERAVVIRHLEICKSCMPRFTFEQTLIVSLRQKMKSAHMPETVRLRLHSLLRIRE